MHPCWAEKSVAGEPKPLWSGYACPIHGSLEEGNAWALKTQIYENIGASMSMSWCPPSSYFFLFLTEVRRCPAISFSCSPRTSSFPNWGAHWKYESTNKKICILYNCIKLHLMSKDQRPTPPVSQFIILSGRFRVPSHFWNSRNFRAITENCEIPDHKTSLCFLTDTDSWKAAKKKRVLISVFALYFVTSHIQ